MGLLKHRPTITMLVPRELVPGRSYEALVVLNAQRPTALEWLKIAVRGDLFLPDPKDPSPAPLHLTLLNIGGQLSAKRAIPAGRTELAFRFDLPPDLPPSYRGVSINARYNATVHASIPWWPDAKSSFELCVTTPHQPSRPSENEPLRFSSDPSGPHAEEPHVEGSLATAAVTVGHVVRGALALSNVKYNTYSSVEIGLVAVEEILHKDRVTGQREAQKFGRVMEIGDLEEGASMPFSFKVPDSMAPSYESRLWRLRWFFYVQAKLRWHSDLYIRIPVFMRAAEPSQETTRQPRRAPPTVGSERVEQIWHHVARELSLDYQAGRLSGSVGAVEYDIVREHRGRHGVFLVGRATYPSLNLDLRLEPRDSALSRFARSQDDHLPPGWNRRYLLTSRAPTQAREVGVALSPFVGVASSLVVDDKTATIDFRGSGQRRTKLLDFADLVGDLARKLSKLPQRIPPPPAMVEARQEWEQLAARLDGSLETARMAVSGHFNALPVEVRTEWSSEGVAERTLLELRLNMIVPAENELHLRGRERGATLDVEGEAQLREGLSQDLLAQLLTDAIAFDLGGDLFTLSLPAPCLEPLTLLERLGAMTQLGELLRARRGPFR